MEGLKEKWNIYMWPEFQKYIYENLSKHELGMYMYRNGECISSDLIIQGFNVNIIINMYVKSSRIS